MGVLDPSAVGVRLVDGAAGDQQMQIGGGLLLAGKRPGRVNPRGRMAASNRQGVDTQCRGNIGRSSQPEALPERQPEQGRRCLRAVDQRKPFLWSE